MNDSITILSTLSAVVMSAVKVTSAPLEAFSWSFFRSSVAVAGSRNPDSRTRWERRPSFWCSVPSKAGDALLDEPLLGFLPDVLHGS